MQKFIYCAAVSLLLLAFVTAQPITVTAGGVKCRIGHASYCAKYGTFRCRRKNIAANPTKACATWADACFYCHGLIRACLKSKMVYTDPKARCQGCSDAWERCMEWITARHFPNRLDRPDDN